MDFKPGDVVEYAEISYAQGSTYVVRSHEGVQVFFENDQWDFATQLKLVQKNLDSGPYEEMFA